MDRDSHILPLESVRNPRDLGGFRAADGRRIKDRLLLRTGHLGGVSERDAAYLRDVCHLGWIFDFRTVQEIELLPDLQVGQARNIHLPAIDPDAEQQNGAAIPQEAFNDLETHLVHLCFTDGAKAMAKDMYPSLIRSEYTQLQYAAFFRMIIEKPDNGAVLWHCSQGKDRGVVEALSEKVRARGGGKAETDVIRAFMGVSEENFSSSLDIIDREYGGMDAYLSGCLFVTEEDITLLRERYLE